MSRRMVITLTEETLRAVQNAVPIYKTIRSKHAPEPTRTSVREASPDSMLQDSSYMAEICSCCICLAGMATVVYARNMEGTVLAC